MAVHHETLLIEIGCEEIPARMIPGAARDLASRVIRILDQAGLAHGAHLAWGGSRRLTVRVEEVDERQPDREETVLGPPAKVAYADDDGTLSKAALGFAKKQGIEPDELVSIDSERGRYVGFSRHVEGATVGELLARELPESVAAMSFPKSMRWADGGVRWVRPVHWLLALHGEAVLSIELFGTRSTGRSEGHRFLGAGPVEVGHPDRYRSELEAAYVLVDPGERRRRLVQGLEEAADRLDAVLVGDPELLEEVSDLVEWPGVVTGHFDAGYLDLPRELLITTLRHHQKCFSLQNRSGELLPAFLAVANTDRDTAGHIHRGNEWVVGGRLEDARFFWLEDRRRPLASLSERLAGVVFHGKVGSYADKARRVAVLAAALATRLGLTAEAVEECRSAASLSKNDLLTGTVGEFPELQGRVGGLMLAAEGASEAVWQGVYEHYQPAGPEDPVPATSAGRVASVADKLDSVVQLIAAGQRPSGSRDPLGLRRAGNGIIRILLAGEWPITLTELAGIGGEDTAALDFLRERLEAVLREAGYTVKEILAVTRPRVGAAEANDWSLIDIRARLEAIKRVRGRDDFRHLVKLTERVDNIVTKNAETIREIVARASKKACADGHSASTALAAMVDQYSPLMESNSEQKCYDEIVHILSEFIDPVERFFTDCLVIDPENPETTRHRFELLVELNKLFTRYFDIRELAGEAEGRVQ